MHAQFRVQGRWAVDHALSNSNRWCSRGGAVSPHQVPLVSFQGCLPKPPQIISSESSKSTPKSQLAIWPCFLIFGSAYACRSCVGCDGGSCSSTGLGALSATELPTFKVFDARDRMKFTLGQELDLCGLSRDLWLSWAPLLSGDHTNRAAAEQ